MKKCDPSSVFSPRYPLVLLAFAVLTFPRVWQNVIRRRIRQFLVASLIAFHAAVTLCGPCLHELPGLGHESAASTSSQPASQHPVKSPHDTGDSCPVCHFLAHGQLPVTLSCAPSVLLPGAWIRPHPTSIEFGLAGREFRQRAPPIVSA